MGQTRADRKNVAMAPAPSDNVCPGPFRSSVPKHPPPDDNEESKNDPSRYEGTSAQGRTDGLCGTDLDPVKTQKATERAGSRTGTESRNGVSPQPNLHGEVRKFKGFVNPTDRLCSIGYKRPRGEKATTGTEAWQIHHDVVPRPADLNVFPINGEAKVGEDLERKAHNWQGTMEL